MDVKAEINGRVCDFSTLVEANSQDGVNVMVRIESDCPRVQATATELIHLDAFQEVLRRPLIETTPAPLSAKHKLHPPCLVPVGVRKAIAAAARSALPSQCEIALTRI